MEYLFNDDALKVLDNMINTNFKVDLIVTDPPYKITSRGSYGGTGGMLKHDLSMKGKIFKNNDLTIDKWVHKLFKILKDSGHLYIMCNNKNLLNYLNVINKAGFKVFKTLIWDKQNKIVNMYYMDSHEYIIFARKGKAKKINNNGTSSILRVQNKKTKLNGVNIHDTEKPVNLMKILVENSSNENEIVLDPFMGVGSTGLACKELKRDFIGIELDHNYFKIAKERLLNNG